jgi:cryptochrome
MNNANWMWLSASSFFYQFGRVYSPIAFPKKTDANGDYVRKWLPQLKDYPKAFIYEPWKAPLAVQTKCGCIIGKDYPKPIVDHDEARKENLDKMGAAYAAARGEAPSAKKAPAAKKPAKVAAGTKRKKEEFFTAPDKKTKA